MSMKTLQEEREAIVELKEDVRFLTVQAWREEKSVSDVTDEIMKLLLSHEENVVERIRKSFDHWFKKGTEDVEDWAERVLTTADKRCLERFAQMDSATYETATLEEKMKMMLELAREANAEQKRIVDEADDRQDNRSEWDGKKYFEHEGEVFEDDRQRIHVEVIFNTHQNPGSLLHLREIAKAYLAPKGIALRDDLSIEV